MKDIIKILSSLPITKGADNTCITSACLLSEPEFHNYEKGQVILPPGQQSDALYVLCEGSASAYNHEHDKNILLRSFKPYEIFGVSTLFTEHPFATMILARSQCSVLVLPKEFLTYLIDNDSTVRYQYIAFLAEKTLFLNKKISCLTAGSAEQKLAFWLDANAEQDELILDIPMNALCTMLDIGRASLYRALDKLEVDGFIAREQKKIRLLDRDHMLNHYN